jgi:Spy/CpxP family protein refolding chaperone
MFSRIRIWTLGIVAVLVAAFALPVLAHQARNKGPHASRFKQLLTVEQMEQIRPWLKAEREASQPLTALRKQLRDAVLAESPDQGKIAALQSQIAPLQAEALSRRVSLAQRVAALLTPEQREQFRASRVLPPFLDPAGAGHPAFGHGRRGPHAPDAPAPGAN